jgi:hypothetical protein
MVLHQYITAASVACGQMTQNRHPGNTDASRLGEGRLHIAHWTMPGSLQRTVLLPGAHWLEAALQILAPLKTPQRGKLPLLCQKDWPTHWTSLPFANSWHSHACAPCHFRLMPMRHRTLVPVSPRRSCSFSQPYSWAPEQLILSLCSALRSNNHDIMTSTNRNAVFPMTTWVRACSTHIGTWSVRPGALSDQQTSRKGACIFLLVFQMEIFRKDIVQAAGTVQWIPAVFSLWQSPVPCRSQGCSHPGTHATCTFDLGFSLLHCRCD